MSERKNLRTKLPMNNQPYLTHVQLVKTIADNRRRVGDLTALEDLTKAQHFEINLELFEAAGKFVWEQTHDGEYFFDSITKPPSNPATFRIGNEPSIYFIRTNGNLVTVDQIGSSGAIVRHFHWTPGTNKLFTQSHFEGKSDVVNFHLSLAALSLGMTLSLINSPKLVEISRNATRQERRAANRTTKLPVDAWHRVTWRTAAGRTTDSHQGDESSSKKPLHYRRGHVRTAESHFTGAFETKLTETGWGQWIDGQWVGHPAFGIKKSMHAPRLDRHGLSEFIKRSQRREIAP